MRKDTANWIALADYDIETARHMLATERYPDDLQRSLKEYPKSVAKDYLNQTLELVQWLEQHPNLSES